MCGWVGLHWCSSFHSTYIHSLHSRLRTLVEHLQSYHSHFNHAQNNPKQEFFKSFTKLCQAGTVPISTLGRLAAGAPADFVCATSAPVLHSSQTHTFCGTTATTTTTTFSHCICYKLLQRSAAGVAQPLRCFNDGVIVAAPDQRRFRRHPSREQQWYCGGGGGAIRGNQIKLLTSLHQCRMLCQRLRHEVAASGYSAALPAATICSGAAWLAATFSAATATWWMRPPVKSGSFPWGPPRTEVVWYPWW